MKIVLALDLASKNENLALLKELKGSDIWVKVGLRSFIRDGVSFIESIQKDFKVFLDLKLYDIPNTMADAAYECALLGVDMLTIHASSGIRAMESVMNRIQKLESKPLIIAVSALTSFNEDEFNLVYKQDIKSAVGNFAKLALDSGVDGMVTSLLESKIIKEVSNNKLLSVVPGIRPAGSDLNDQSRVATPLEAKNAGADFIVIGRPIYKSQKPRMVLDSIIQEIQ